MQLSLSGLLPTPLRDRLQDRPSLVWKKDLSLDESQQVFIQAPSGSGKTTLIHILYGIRTDYEGQVRWGNTLLSAMSAERLAALRRESVSVIFQDLRIFPGIQAAENLEVKRMLTNTVTRDTALGWMDRLGIGAKKVSSGKTLSYGEQQRLAIVRALVQPFEWLLMDEPFSHLDKANTRIAADLISEVVAARKASFLLADLDANDFFPYTQTLTL